MYQPAKLYVGSAGIYTFLAKKYRLFKATIANNISGTFVAAKRAKCG